MAECLRNDNFRHKLLESYYLKLLYRKDINFPINVNSVATILMGTHAMICEQYDNNNIDTLFIPGYIFTFHPDVNFFLHLHSYLCDIGFLSLIA